MADKSQTFNQLLWKPSCCYGVWVLGYGFTLTNALLCWDPRPLLTSVQQFEK